MSELCDPDEARQVPEGVRQVNEVSALKRPFRCEIQVLFAATDDEGMIDRLVDAVLEAGGIFEGASCEAMDRAEVIPGSPLDRVLHP